MGTEITLFGNTGSNVTRKFMNDDAFESNVAARGANVPTLAFEGKVWSVVINGEKRPLMRLNEDGDQEPVSVMRIIVVGSAKNRGRTYYEGNYDPAKPMQPMCWSHDGVRPDPAVQTPQAPDCKSCPQAAKGSKVNTNGKPGVACSSHLLLAVIPALTKGQTNFPPLRMKLAITSLWDESSPQFAAENWFAWDQYVKYLARHNVKHTAFVVTKMRFDPSVAYPKILFSADRVLDDDEMYPHVADVVRSQAVKDLVSGKVPGEVSTSVVIEHDTVTEKQLDAPAAASVVAQTVESAEPKKAKKAAAKAESASVAPAATQPTQKATAAVGDGLDEILKDWGGST